MESILKIPFYIKFALVSIGLFALGYGLYIGQTIILPLIFATILAILLNPFVNFLVRIKIPRVVAITITVVTAVIVTAGLLSFISMQLSQFSETYPKFKTKFDATTEHAIGWTSETFNIQPEKINTWIEQTQQDAYTNMNGAIGQTLSLLTGIVIVVVLLPVYLFMILYYKHLFLEFIRKLFHQSHHSAVFQVLLNSKMIIQSYLIGLLVEAAIVATLTAVGLILLGIEYAIIIALLGALLNVIPYIGGLVAIAIPVFIAYVTKDSSTYVILVIGLYLLVQFIDNNIIVPRVVASKVKINALIAIIVVLLGGAFWGIPGMFLSIPLTALVKVICDHIEPLKPWGFLLGNTVPTVSKMKFDFIKKKSGKYSGKKRIPITR